MKKTIIILLSVFMVLSLFVSCNDGEEGLFQMAANSVKKESFKIYNIINKESDSVYIVATDNGIAKYNTSSKSFSDFIGTGVMAANAIWAKADGSEFIYYDDSDSAYKNQNGDSVETDHISNMVPQPFYSVNGEEFTYVFKDASGDYYSCYCDTSLSEAEFKALEPKKVTVGTENISSVSIIGNGMLRVITNSSIYFYDVASVDPVPVKTYGLVVQGLADDNLFITKDGNIYNYNTYVEGIDPEFETGISIYTRPSMFTIFEAETPTYTYIIPEGSSSIIEFKWNGSEVTKATKTVTGLQNITVIAIIDKVDNKLVVLTANNGIQELEMK